MIRPIKYIIAPSGEIYDDSVLHIEVEDHGAGEFITISQPPDFHKVSINPSEWPELRKCIDRLIRQIK